MNRNILKYIAAAAMLCDHVALVFVGTANPAGIAMRMFGRLAAPIMCYFLVEGFIHTSSEKKYGMRLLMFALISQMPFSYLVTGKIFSTELNMIFTLFFCFMILVCLEKISDRFLRVLCALIFTVLCTFSDWGLMAPLWTFIFVIYRDDKKKKHLFYLLSCVFWLCRCISLAVGDGKEWYSVLWQFAGVGFIPVINFYNGQGGKSSKFSKWFFYWFYPLHLLVLGVIFRNVLPYV